MPLDRLEEIGQGRALEQILLPMMAGLDDIPALALSPDQAGRLRKGQQLVGIAANHGLHVATDGSVPVALVEVSGHGVRSEEHTSGLQSLMRITYAVFCLTKKKKP